MKALIQRVIAAKVSVEEFTVGEIGKGILVFLAVVKSDSSKDVEFIANKIANLRIFSDEHGKMNLSIKDVSGELLIVSQFTLAADCRRGNRPSFDNAEEPAKAEAMYMEAVRMLEAEGIQVKTGMFAADMKVALVNDGPVTFLIDSRA